MSTAKDSVPHSGHLKNFWQYAFMDDWQQYVQYFYTPPDGQKLQVVFFNPGGENTLLVNDIRLERCHGPNIFLGSASFSNRLDYSGWSELSKASIIKANGKFVLNIAHGGYALSDLVPARTGDYLLAGKRSNTTVFYYDADMRRIGSKGNLGSRLTVPPECAYFQLFCAAGVVEGLTSIAPAEKRGVAPSPATGPKISQAKK